MRTRSLFLLVSLLFCSQPALAAVPDPGHSAVDPCLIVCPNGDFAFHVTVRDIIGAPIANANVTIDLCACPAVALCPGEPCLQAKLSDASGNVTFNIKAGGVCTSSVSIQADGVQLGVRVVASPDQNGDLFVDAADVSVAVGKLGNSDPTADFDCDGAVSPADVTIIGAHQEHNCSPVPTQTQSWGLMKAIYR